jgi:hypothetical protein
MNIKPILFNTEMVEAVLDGIKHCTRRVVKGYIPKDAQFGYTAFTPKGCISCRGTFKDGYGEKFFKLPYQKGDILYVRETFAWCPCWDCGMESICNQGKDRRYHDEKKEYGCYMYRASCEDNEYPSVDIWHPSIHMPKKAARIWLKVTNVSVERLQDIDINGIRSEGVVSAADLAGDMDIALKKWEMEILWDSTINKSNIDTYGWEANPFVWVVEFERCERPESED